MIGQLNAIYPWFNWQKKTVAGSIKQSRLYDMPGCASTRDCCLVRRASCQPQIHQANRRPKSSASWAASSACWCNDVLLCITVFANRHFMQWSISIASLINFMPVAITKCQLSVPPRHTYARHVRGSERCLWLDFHRQPFVYFWSAHYLWLVVSSWNVTDISEPA